MEEKLYELLKNYKNAIEDQKTLWQFIGQNFDQQMEKPFVKNLWEKIFNKTAETKKAVEDFLGIK